MVVAVALVDLGPEIADTLVDARKALIHAAGLGQPYVVVNIDTSFGLVHSGPLARVRVNRNREQLPAHDTQGIDRAAAGANLVVEMRARAAPGTPRFADHFALGNGLIWSNEKCRQVSICRLGPIVAEHDEQSVSSRAPGGFDCACFGGVNGFAG